jgi:hypothetical protein
LGKRRILLSDDQRRRLAVKGKALGRRALRELAAIVTPDTILRWHRELVAQKWDFSHLQHRVGRPRTREEIVRLVVQMAKENSTWGHDRTQGALQNLLRGVLEATETKAVLLPPRRPNLNAQIERYMRSMKSECLERMILFGARSLCRALAEFAAHYHQERNRQGLGNNLIDPSAEVGRVEGKVACRNRLGGLFRYYYRDAARSTPHRTSCHAGELHLTRALSGGNRNRLARTSKLTTEIGPGIRTQQFPSQGFENRSSFLTIRPPSLPGHTLSHRSAGRSVWTLAHFLVCTSFCKSLRQFKFACTAVSNEQDEYGVR